MLGVYMELAKPLSPRLIEDELRRSYSDGVLERNTRALKVGMEVGRAVAAG
jgi:Pyruvate/2-oxoacid:ferredoxin oxidoreductase gamma subunit